MSSLDQADADAFPAIYKDVRCPRCNLAYSDGDRTPLLLQCGHAVCERCYGKSNHLLCGVCNEKTVLAAGEDKSKHFYTYGLIHDIRSKSRGHGSRTRARKPVDIVLRKSAIKKPLIKYPCDECLLARATVQCRQCWIEVCLPCFNKIHAPWALRKHKPEALIVPVAARFCLVPDCLDHSQNLATILCISCSDEGSENYICTTCQRSKKHEGHKFLDVASPAPNLAEFRSVVGEMEVYLKLLRERVEMLSNPAVV